MMPKSLFTINNLVPFSVIYNVVEPGGLPSVGSHRVRHD